MDSGRVNNEESQTPHTGAGVRQKALGPLSEPAQIPREESVTPDFLTLAAHVSFIAGLAWLAFEIIRRDL
jgi:hypothetical protein